MKAKLFLISAASGTGKSSLINAVLDDLNSKNFNVELSISHTTRKKRGGSQDYYIFTSEDDFKNKVSNDFFLDSVIPANIGVSANPTAIVLQVILKREYSLTMLCIKGLLAPFDTA